MYKNKVLATLSLAMIFSCVNQGGSNKKPKSLSINVSGLSDHSINYLRSSGKLGKSDGKDVGMSAYSAATPEVLENSDVSQIEKDLILKVNRNQEMSQSQLKTFLERINKINQHFTPALQNKEKFVERLLNAIDDDSLKERVS